MRETYYTLQIKQRMTHITKAFEVVYTPPTPCTLSAVIEMHKHYDKDVYSIESITKHYKSVSDCEPELPAADHDAPKSGIGSRSMEG